MHVGHTPSLRRRSRVASHQLDQQHARMMARRGTERVDHIDVKALWYQEATEQVASSRPRRKRHQRTECRQHRSSHDALQNKSDVTNWKWTQHEKCWQAAKARDDTKMEIGRRPSVIPRTLARSSKSRVTAPWTHERGSLVKQGQANATCKLELQPTCMAVTAAKFKP